MAKVNESASEGLRQGVKSVPWIGAAMRMSSCDIERIGVMSGVGVEEIRAVLEVETAGSGFDVDGRVRMLFEPHVFWRELPEGKRKAAQAQGLAYPKWKAGAYPRDSYPRLIAAMEIDRRAALRSCSWGVGQIMGFNASVVGFDTAEAMVKAFAADECDQLQAMMRFIKSAGLDDKLRRHDWAGFARGYNGKNYAAHGYHTKLERSYVKWAGIPAAKCPLPNVCDDACEQSYIPEKVGWFAAIWGIITGKAK